MTKPRTARRFRTAENCLFTAKAEDRMQRDAVRGEAADRMRRLYDLHRWQPTAEELAEMRRTFGQGEQGQPR